MFSSSYASPWKRRSRLYANSHSLFFSLHFCFCDSQYLCSVFVGMLIESPRPPGSSHLYLKLLLKLVCPSVYHFVFSIVSIYCRFFRWHTLVCHFPSIISHPRHPLHPRNGCSFTTSIPNISIRRCRHRILSRRGSI